MKCKAAPAVATIRQHEPYCHACIETGIAQKARVSTKGAGLISTGDTALLALSGGAASAGLLCCMAAMQAPPDALHPIRNKLPYQLSVLHIDCAMPAQPQQQLQAQLAALAAAAEYTQQQPLLLHVSDVFCTQQELQQLLQQAPSQPDQQQEPRQQQPPQHLQQLQELVAAISDPTGREDLVTHLRDQLLLRSASVLGCSRLLRGDSASRMAVRVIAEAAKGRGFSLPADIQNMDGRLMQTGGPAVLQPLREVTHKELQELCRFKGLPLLHEGSSSSSSGSGGLGGGSGSSSSVNTLAERFVGEMEGSLPASIYTIIRTAAHLEPFGFSDAPALVPQAAEALKNNLNQKRKQQLAGAAQQQHADGSAHCVPTQSSWQLCSICRAPLPAAPAQAGGTGDGSSRLCYSCNRQILQQVKPAAAAVAAKPLLLEEKMQRLKQLLPPGLLLQDEEDV
jgi:cytoplasmic tRNA 2-thiolation protein 2